MTRVNATCEYVRDGDTFRTTAQIWVRLARVNAPEIGTPSGQRAKETLERLIFGKPITYESVARDNYGRIVAEVWVNGTNVNDYMRAQGYT